MSKFFISYHHKEPDSSLAHTFKKRLENVGHSVFIDTGIEWGNNWAKKIEEALNNADYLLLFLSKESATREMVVEEVTIAKELAAKNDGIPVILPLRVKLPFLSDLPYRLNAILREVQQTIWNGDEDTERLINQLLGLIEGKENWSSEVKDDNLDQPKIDKRPAPQTDPRRLIKPGGSIGEDHYVIRDVDQIVMNTITSLRGIATVQAPRQTGKTSLLMHVYNHVKKEKKNYKVAYIDFQTAGAKDLSNTNSLWHWIAQRTAEQMQIDDFNENCWKAKNSYEKNILEFLKNFVLYNDGSILLLCFDELDKLFYSPIKTEFFSSIRAFYNRGAIDSYWERVHWLLATSYEPSFFIEDSSSPFNISEPERLKPFNRKEILTLGFKLGLKLNSDTVDKIEHFLGGRPFLTHQILYNIAQKPEFLDMFFDSKTCGNGIFKDHLHRYLMHFRKDKACARAMKLIINKNGCDDLSIRNRLEAAGLVKFDSNQRIVPFCKLYADFFNEQL